MAAGDCDRRLRAQAGKRTVWTVLGLRHSIHVRQEPGISTVWIYFFYRSFTIRVTFFSDFFCCCSLLGDAVQTFWAASFYSVGHIQRSCRHLMYHHSPGVTLHVAMSLSTPVSYLTMVNTILDSKIVLVDFS